MSSSFYISLTGLQAYSNGLNSISNNVANMNTTGFKKNDLVFHDLMYRYDSSPFNASSDNFKSGSGVSSNMSFVNFNQGEIRETGNDLDVAIDGRGFFILKDRNDQLYFTRNGTFEFSDNGYLVLQSTDLRVQAVNSSGQLDNISIRDLTSDPAKATSEVLLSGNVSSSSTSYTLSDVVVYDALGKAHTLSVTLTLDTTQPRRWNIEVEDSDGVVIDSSGSVEFQTNGSPADGLNAYTFQFTADDLPAQDITLNFGQPGEFDGVTSFSGASEVVIKEQDGYANGGLTSATFDKDGVLERIYSNGNTYYGKKLALANFQVLNTLQPIGKGVFQAKDQSDMSIGSANTSGFGTIKGKSIELSNVELTDQFTDMVIIQRGYQASSQVLTATNEMIQQLIEATKSR